MKLNLKFITVMLFVVLSVTAINSINAASASITANKTSVTVGENVTVTLNIDAATWNAHITGAISDIVLDCPLDGQNQKTTKSYNIDTSKPGTYTVNLSGDITDGITEVTTDLNQAITITVKEKPVTPPSVPSNSGASSGNSGTSAPVKSSDATLKALKLEMEGLSPSFNKNTLIYTLSVGNDVNSLKVTASPTHSQAKCGITGNTNLQYGDNTIKITVTAENGATKTYKIIVTKAENPEKANAYLTNLLVENMNFNQEFVKETLNYTLDNVPGDMLSLSLSAFPESPKASIKVEGNENLVEGENIIKILVTAEDGKTTKEYVITAVKDKAIAANSNTVEQNNSVAMEYSKKDKSNNFLSIICEKQEYQLLILVYIFAVIEFVEILYLFMQLKAKNRNAEQQTDDKIEKTQQRRGKVQDNTTFSEIEKKPTNENE